MIHKMEGMLKGLPSLRHQSRKMQQRLLLYYCSLALALFGIFLLILSLAGTFSNAKAKLKQVLTFQENSIYLTLSIHLETLEAQGIALSENVSALLKDTLYQQPASGLNDQPDKLLELQQAIYTPLITALNVSSCSGAFVVLDATTNTAAPGAEDSRSGLYLRFANLSATKSARKEVNLFRGLPEIARQIPLEMHNRWNLEFNISRLPGYADQLAQERLLSGSLSDSCLWSSRINIMDTWEDAIIVTVPVIDGSGAVGGVCGMEISDLYFRLAYSSAESEFGSMITLLAPVDGDILKVSEALHGGLNGARLDNLEDMRIKKGEFYNTYSCIYSGEAYLGVQQVSDAKTADGVPLAIVTLIPADGFIEVENREWSKYVLCALTFLVLMFILSKYLSYCFVSPIITTLDAIRNNSWEEHRGSTYMEIDDLFDFLEKKDQDYEEKLQALSEEKQAVQLEVERLAYSRKQEIDPDDYQHFLEGLKLLTKTERKIFDYYLSGKKVKEILELASIKESTLRYHNQNIYGKLGVNSLKQMLRYTALMKQEMEEKE